jgi:hypothetical protein
MVMSVPCPMGMGMRILFGTFGIQDQLGNLVNQFGFQSIRRAHQLLFELRRVGAKRFIEPILDTQAIDDNELGGLDAFEVARTELKVVGADVSGEEGFYYGGVAGDIESPRREGSDGAEDPRFVGRRSGMGWGSEANP